MRQLANVIMGDYSGLSTSIGLIIIITWAAVILVGSTWLLWKGEK